MLLLKNLWAVTISNLPLCNFFTKTFLRTLQDLICFRESLRSGFISPMFPTAGKSRPGPSRSCQEEPPSSSTGCHQCWARAPGAQELPQPAREEQLIIDGGSELCLKILEVQAETKLELVDFQSWLLCKQLCGFTFPFFFFVHCLDCPP